MLAPLLETGASFVSIQKDVRAKDLAMLNACPDIDQYADALAEFSDTAALISDLDLVISVDTSVVHLAGALGRPVWVLLPICPTGAGCSIATPALGIRRLICFDRTIGAIGRA